MVKGIIKGMSRNEYIKEYRKNPKVKKKQIEYVKKYQLKNKKRIKEYEYLRNKIRTAKSIELKKLSTEQLLNRFRYILDDDLGENETTKQQPI